MRAYVPDYRLVTPKVLSEALGILAREPGTWQPFAGGTDLMVLLEAGRLPHKNYLNIWNLPELRGISSTTDHVTLGALTTYTEIQSDPILREEFPMLCQAASETGGLAIQNRGTIGGNIANASPAADSPPALLAYNAELELLSVRGSRWVPYQTFHTGYKTMIMQPDELLARVRLPRLWPDLHHYYRKVGTRKAQAISKVCLAAAARVSEGTVDHIRIALGSIAPIPLRCLKTEEALRGERLDKNIIAQAKAALAREIVPIDDIRSTKSYRFRVSLNLLEDFLAQLAPSAHKLHRY
jgi:CO/xanthine dehydrogenase FAD-binding subunit